MMRGSLLSSFIRKREVLVLVAGALTACQAGNNDLFSSGGAGGGNNHTQSGGTFSGGTASMGSNTGGSTGQFAGSNGSQTVGVGGGCAGTTVKAEKIPLDMYIMLDESGSMDDTVGGGGTKWDAVTGALKTFVQSSQANGLGVGLQYFGVLPGGTACYAFECNVSGDCGPAGSACGPCDQGFCDGTFAPDSCNAADYAIPNVEIATLPGNANALVQSINLHSPTTGTPTSAALQGDIDHSKAWAQAHTDHVVVAVFATDGDPGECDTDLNHIDQIAAAGFNGTPSIRTFVIGVGSSLTALNGIAAAGGTNQAFIVDTNANANMQFLQALQAIQGTALACSYVIPVPMMGIPDYTQVNVEYTPGGGGPAQIIPNVASKAQCPASGNAWYYDNPAAPTQILLCDSTCTTVSADTMGEIDVVLGCQTVPA